MSDPIPPTSDKFCAQCGSSLEPDVKFCSNCGKEIGVPSGTGLLPAGAPVQPTFQSENFQQPQPQSQYYPDGTLAPAYSDPARITTPQGISEVKAPRLDREEIILIVIITGMSGISHLLRYLLIYNRFPSFWEFIIPFPFYFLLFIILFGTYKGFLQKRGLQASLDVDRYEHMLSLFLSTFFLTTIAHRLRLDKSKSTIPESVSIPQSSKLGFSYQQYDHDDYIESYIQPRSYMFQTVISLIIAIVLLYMYINDTVPILTETTRLISAYFGAFVVVNVAPAVGKYNREFSQMGRFRTLLIFLIGFIVTLLALFGITFITALSNRLP